jgi:hypothetical protein
MKTKVPWVNIGLHHLESPFRFFCKIDDVP